jgi:tetratricopeptide (TPR) repeat protein/predicted Ser/Thr protein kinase
MGTSLGPYKLLERLGEGGMGVVYLAEQEQPVRRQVALKIIKPGMDSAAVIARFEAERQALALMDHSNIARVYDAGTTPQGRPYFVMELVRGLPINRYCDEHRLPPEQRMEMIISVCRAVQHAHQKGVIHRDLKPGNILVAVQDGKPLAKVIDFGVAKAIHQSSLEQTAFTQLGMLIGTPEYMSPEQAGSNPAEVDTRSDVYALGVILYELLTGSTPLDRRQLRKAGYEQMLRTIRETDPPRPSTRLSTAGEATASSAALRRMEPRRLARLLAGDVDAIVMKCLQKDRGQRYETVSALASDIGHFLSGEPVSAGPPGMGYRIGKFIRRHKVAIAVAAVLMLSFIAGAAGTTVGLIRESRQRKIAETQRGIAEQQRSEAQRQQQLAEQQRAIADAVSNFQVNMLQSADPAHTLGAKLTVVQAVTTAGEELDKGELGHQPAVEAAVRSAVGQTLQSLGEYKSAEHHLRRALDLRRQLAKSPDDPKIALAATDLGLLLQLLGQVDEAGALLDEALNIQRKNLPPNDPQLATALSNLGLVRQDQGNTTAAEELFHQALTIDRNATAAPDAELVHILGNLASLLQEQNRLDDAQPLFQEAVTISRKSLALDPAGLPVALQNLGTLYLRQIKPAEAEPLYREALAIDRKVLPPEHPAIGQALNNLAIALERQRQKDPLKLREAEACSVEALKIFRAALPPDDPQLAKALRDLATIYIRESAYTQAEPLLNEALSINRKLGNSPDVELSTATILDSLGRVAAAGDPARAEEATHDFSESLSIRRRLLGDKEPATRGTAQLLANHLQKIGQLDAAAALRREFNLRPGPATGPAAPSPSTHPTTQQGIP